MTHSHEPGSPGTLRASADFGAKVTRPSVTGHWPPAAEKISCEDKEPYKVYSGVMFALAAAAGAQNTHQVRGWQVAAGAGRSQSPHHQHYHPSIPHIPPPATATGQHYRPDNTADILTYLHNT